MIETTDPRTAALAADMADLLARQERELRLLAQVLPPDPPPDVFCVGCLGGTPCACESEDRDAE